MIVPVSVARSPIKVNLKLYDAPEQRYCPAAVYEIVRDTDGSNPSVSRAALTSAHESRTSPVRSGRLYRLIPR